MSQVLYQFSQGRFEPQEWCDPSRGSTLVADSFRLEDGQVVALERHLARFSDSITSMTDIPSERLEAFLTALPGALPLQGTWFPRIEAVETPGGATLRYRQRPAPAWEEEVILARAPHDPRRYPHVKGPDLEALMALRTQVQSEGAHEAIITTEGDYLVEGAYSSLMIWLHDADSPSVISSSTPHLPGVTEAVLRDIASEQGLEVEERNLRLTDLEGAEVWILSALHGVRVATSFVGGPTLSAQPGRRAVWQELWLSQAAPVSP